MGMSNQAERNRQLYKKLTGLRKIGDFEDRTDFHSAHPSTGNLSGDADSLVQVFRFDQKVAPKLFACLGKRPVRDRRLSFANPDAGCGSNRKQWICCYVLPFRFKLVREFGGLLVTVVAHRVCPEL